MFSGKQWLAPISLWAVLCASAGAQAQALVVSAEAKRLAQAMQLRESTRLGAELSLQKALEQGRISQQELDCTKASSLDFAVDAYSTAIATALSADEIKRANAFFTSPAGRAYLRYSRSIELKQRNIPDPDPKPELDAKETAAATKFLETSAGKKLIEQRVFETSALKSSLAQGFLAIKTQCAG